MAHKAQYRKQVALILQFTYPTHARLTTNPFITPPSHKERTAPHLQKSLLYRTTVLELFTTDPAMFGFALCEEMSLEAY